MNWRKRNVRTSVIALWIIGITALVLVLVSVFSQGKDYSVITSDGVGYYSYLPNLFQTNSLSSQVPDNRFIVDIEGKGVNKYYVGTALSMSPFYALGKLFSSNDTSGFTLSCQIAISFSGIFYLILGLVFTQKLLRLFQFSETVIFITLLALFFGTNLMVYSVFQPSMSHIYSFCWIAGFVLSSKKYVQTVTAKYLYLSVACLAILILVRPINGIVVFLIPFIVGSGQGTKLYFFSFCLTMSFSSSAINRFGLALKSEKTKKYEIKYYDLHDMKEIGKQNVDNTFSNILNEYFNETDLPF